MSDTLLMTLLVGVCAITYSFEIVFGLAGTILMLPILGFFFDKKVTAWLIFFCGLVYLLR